MAERLTEEEVENRLAGAVVLPGPGPEQAAAVPAVDPAVVGTEDEVVVASRSVVRS